MCASSSYITLSMLTGSDALGLGSVQPSRKKEAFDRIGFPSFCSNRNTEIDCTRGASILLKEGLR